MAKTVKSAGTFDWFGGAQNRSNPGPIAPCSPQLETTFLAIFKGLSGIGALPGHHRYGLHPLCPLNIHNFER